MSDQQTTEAPARLALHIDDEWELQRQVDRCNAVVDLLGSQRVHSIDPDLARRASGAALTLITDLQAFLVKGRS